jgi:hypothetical protein
MTSSHLQRPISGPPFLAETADFVLHKSRSQSDQSLTERSSRLSIKVLQAVNTKKRRLVQRRQAENSLARLHIEHLNRHGREQDMKLLLEKQYTI